MTHSILPAQSRRRFAVPAVPLVCALAAALAHARALGNGYALDDATIVAHPLLQSARTLPAALASPWWFETRRLYRPLALVSLGAERLATGGAPSISHGVNVALHAIVAALVARLCLRWISAPAALVAGASFALLPVHAEAVATIVGRAELLSALAMVALMLLVTRDEPPTTRARLCAALLAAAALASKESGAAAPLLAFAAARSRSNQQPHATSWASSALLGTLLLLAARVVVLGTLGGDSAHPYFVGLTSLQRIGVALSMLPRTAAMLLLPVQPAIEEVPPLSAALHPSLPLVVGGLVLLLLTLGLVARHLRHPTPLTLGASVLATSIAPTSNLLFAEGALTARTLYAPSIGAAVMLGAAIALVASTRPRVLLLALASVACVFAGNMSWRETRVWRDTPSVIATMVARRPDNYRGHELVAYAARDAGRLADAAHHFGEAIALFPRDPELLTDAATVALRLRDTSTATRWLTTAVQASPRAARARTRLYGIMLARGDGEAARRLLTEGLAREPDQRAWAALLAASDSNSAVPNADEPRVERDDARAGTRTRMP